MRLNSLKLTQKGDTIIEVLFAITVLTVVLSSTYAIANKSLVTSRLNYERTQATKYAEGQIELIKSVSAGMNKTTFVNTYKTGAWLTGTQCLTRDNQARPTTSAECQPIGLYTMSLRYIPGTSEENGYFLSRVEWDQNVQGGTKNVELAYRVYSEQN